MADANSKRKPGRPPSPEGRGAPIMLTVPRRLLARLDRYRFDALADNRQAAILELIDKGLDHD